VEKILVLQSASCAYNVAHNHLVEKFSEPEIHVVFPAKASNREVKENVDKIIKLKSERFELSSVDWKIFKKANYDFVVVLYNNINSINYDNVEKTALAISPYNVLGIDCFGNRVSFNFLTYYWLKLKRYLLNFCLTIILILYLIVLSTFFSLFYIKRIITDNLKYGC